MPKHLTAEHKKKLSEAIKGNKCYWFGKHRSKKTREKMRKSHLGIPLSEEHRKKISIGNMGRIVSKETRRKIGDARRYANKN